MKPYTWPIATVLKATDGSLVSGATDTEFAGIGIDSRTIPNDHLFVAVVGETHDGHRFVEDVLGSGVKGLIVDSRKVTDLPLKRMAAQGVVCIAVADTTRALGDLARFNRNRSNLKVMAVTGSNGKTSTRILMNHVVSQSFATLGTHGNLNNHIGLPLTLFRLSAAHQVAILELGMNHSGEIDYLGRVCQPDVGIITNVAPAHLEGLGSVDNVARAKGELLPTIREGGTAILNADDSRVAALGGKTDHSVMYFGRHQRAQVRAEKVRLTHAGTTFILITPSGSAPVTLATPAQVMVSNALAAAAVGEVANVPISRIKKGLEAFTPAEGRMGIRYLGGNLILVDDTYNANPGSMAAALQTLARMRKSHRAIAVVGDMLELGAESSPLHREIGRIAGDARIDRLFIAGCFAADVADGAMDRQMAAEHIFTGTKEAIVARLRKLLQPGDTILVKGSRGMAMETIVAAIVQWAGER